VHIACASPEIDRVDLAGIKAHAHLAFPCPRHHGESVMTSWTVLRGYGDQAMKRCFTAAVPQDGIL